MIHFSLFFYHFLCFICIHDPIAPVVLYLNFLSEWSKFVHSFFLSILAILLPVNTTFAMKVVVVPEAKFAFSIIHTHIPTIPLPHPIHILPFFYKINLFNTIIWFIAYNTSNSINLWFYVFVSVLFEMNNLICIDHINIVKTHCIVYISYFQYLHNSLMFLINFKIMHKCVFNAIGLASWTVDGTNWKQDRATEKRVWP